MPHSEVGLAKSPECALGLNSSNHYNDGEDAWVSL